ncbi:Fic family protein [Candidatus Gottesmanbacteria bacterium]|nr:Fic family protein [Candidatus Gottesmanbacteria bacterium]
MIDNLCKDLDERIKHLPNVENSEFITEIVKLLAWFQHSFVVIHPFQDYNGRIARMLTIYILLCLNLPPLEIKAENTRDRKRYISTLQKADAGDYSTLENIIGLSLNESLQKIK